MRKITTAFVTTLVLAIAIYSQRAPIIERIVDFGLQARFGIDATAELEDGLYIALCGAGGPLPAPNASGPCVAVLAGKGLYIIDAGTDSPRNLGRMGIPAGNVDAVFLTHFHSDHIDGLGELATQRWAGGDNHQPLPVYGPTGVTRVVDGFNMAYGHDFVYRHDHHGDSVAPLQAAGLKAIPFRTPKAGELTTVIDENGLTIEALAVKHTPVEPAVGYRIRYKNRSALISGDTVKQTNIEQFANGVDLLVHDALAPNLVALMRAAAEKNGNAIIAKIAHDIPDYHATPKDAATTARDAGVGHLLYYHIVPPLIVPGQTLLFLDGADAIFPNYTIGVDGVTFFLPPNTQDIIKTRSGL